MENKFVRSVHVFSRNPNIVYAIIVIVLILLISIQCAKTSPIPSSSRQLILVVLPTQEAIKGTLIRYQRERSESEWLMVGHPTRIVVGRTGLAWGGGLHSEAPEGIPLKREGDGKSPAGVFRLGSAFGFASGEEMDSLKLPYTRITNGLECIDDASSDYYNHMLRREEADTVDWNSSEKLIDYAEAYELGVVVQHNMDPPRKGGGSCIFLHVWSDPDGHTAGCTAMEKADMESILYWLDAQKTPVLVQLTQ